MGTKVNVIGPGHMTKMASMPIYGKNPLKIFSSRTTSQMTLKLGRKDKGLKPYTSYINDDPGLTLTYFRRSDLVPKVFELEKCKPVYLSKTVVVYEMKIGLIWTPMNVKGQGQSVTLA